MIKIRFEQDIYNYYAQHHVGLYYDAEFQVMPPIGATIWLDEYTTFKVEEIILWPEEMPIIKLPKIFLGKDEDYEKASKKIIKDLKLLGWQRYGYTSL